MRAAGKRRKAHYPGRQRISMIFNVARIRCHHRSPQAGLQGGVRAAFTFYDVALPGFHSGRVGNIFPALTSKPSTR